ncbi:MAG: putative Holliday junction resolvase [Ilumatobacteraceae bacterium]|nr:putative Holliday junction resolvase [Ilumatobacteraceae bacterium]
MRVMALDLGSKRVGVAVSDRSGTIATPLIVLQRSGQTRVDHERIRTLVVEEEAVLLVVGMPLSMDGSMGKAAQAASREARALATVVGVPVETFDERLTTVTADRMLMEFDMRAQDRRRIIDKVAAAVILQSWLDGRVDREAMRARDARDARGGSDA